jgi:RNA polymerase sigma factor (sigma-70 family)
MNDDDFARLLEQHGALIRRVARSYEANEAMAQELAQEIALSIWQALPRFRGDTSLRTYVARIAHNRAITHVTKEARRPRITELHESIPDNKTPPDRAAEREQAQRHLEAAVRSLPLGQKMVVTLALEGLSPEEIADVLGIGVSAASVRLHRAKVTLQASLGKVSS